MGKNQAYKQMQRNKAASHSSGGAGPGEEEGRSVDGMVDGTFHSPAWHAARLAALQTTHTVTWEEWKAQRKEEARKQQEEDGFEEKRMREYREQLDKERAAKLARGRNHADKREKLKKKKDKKKDKTKKSKKKKRSDSGSSESDDGSESKKTKKKSKKRKSDEDSSDEEESSDDKKSKKKQKKAKESDGDLSSASESDKEKGPVRLSSFFTGGDGDLSEDDNHDRRPAEKDPATKSKADSSRKQDVGIKSIFEEARKRAEIGHHMVAEVKKAEGVANGSRWDRR